MAHAAGSTQEFTSDRVSLGRGSSNDLRFDPQGDRVVSSRHAEITVVDGVARIDDVGSRNGVFVNGRRVDRPTALRPGDVVRLGDDGPQFGVDVVAAPQPMDEAPIDESMDYDATMLNPAGRAAPPPPAPAAPPPPASPPRIDPFGSGGEEDHTMRRPVDPAPPPRPVPTPAAADGEKRLIGENTLMHVVNRAVAGERKRTVTKLVIVAALLLGAVGLVAVFSGGGKPSDWDEILADKEQSLYVVMLKDENGDGVQPIGTAWCVGDGKLATNVHVIEDFTDEQLEKNLVIARSSESPPRDVVIKKLRHHPGYERMANLMELYAPFRAGDGFARTSLSFDVAICEVREEDRDNMAPGLKIASRDRLKALKRGESIAYLGFPMEGRSNSGFNIDRPSPLLQDGSMSRVSQVLHDPGDEELEVLLNLDVQIQGGASGSPMFDKNGEVIGIMSAGDFVFPGLEQVGIFRLNSGNAYAQRGDLLLDLLDNDPETRLDRIVDDVRDDLQEQFRRGVSEPRAVVSYLAMQLMNQAGKEWQLVDEQEFKLEKGGSAGQLALDGVNIAKGIPHACVVLPLDYPGRLEFKTEVYYSNRWQDIEPDNPSKIAYLSIGFLELKQTIETRALVSLPDTDAFSDEVPLRGMCYWLALVPK